MKVRAILLIPVIFAGAFATATVVASHRGDKRSDKTRSQQVERKASVDANVQVNICVTSGAISVHGWDKNEVWARSPDAAQIELRGLSVKPESGPAKKIEVVISDKPDLPHVAGNCQGFSDIEINVPRGATVQLQTRDGDIEVVDVAAAYVNTQNGDVSIERAARSVDVGSVGGTISLKNSSGRINLHSLGGAIEASDVKPAETGDVFEASSVSGDVMLSHITHAQLNAHTVNGSVNLIGPLAHGGRYGFRTYSGDVTLELPADASFRLNAKISQRSEIVTDFPLTFTSEPSGPADEPPPATPPTAPVPPAGKGQKGNKGLPAPKVVVVVPSFGLQHINAVHGTGDALIYLASFSGTVHLRKN
jgi:hypothetical protein